MITNKQLLEKQDIQKLMYYVQFALLLFLVFITLYGENKINILYLGAANVLFLIICLKYRKSVHNHLRMRLRQLHENTNFLYEIECQINSDIQEVYPYYFNIAVKYKDEDFEKRLKNKYASKRDIQLLPIYSRNVYKLISEIEYIARNERLGLNVRHSFLDVESLLSSNQIMKYSTFEQAKEYKNSIEIIVKLFMYDEQLEFLNLQNEIYLNSDQVKRISIPGENKIT